MDSKHSLHSVHTGRTESDAVAQASEKACNSCLEHLSQIEKPTFHCDPCDYTVCQPCDQPKSHPVHPNHDVYYITPILPWKCEVCKRDSGNIQEIQCYRCDQCNFHMCKRCYGGVNSLLHQHTLYRTDVRFVYHQSSGEWSCDICGNNNGPGHYYPAHCSSCQFDLCDNCIKPYRSTFHPGHVLYKADSNVTYPKFNGGWRCDRCSLSFIPQVNNVPFHCSQCEFDLCDSCMKNAVTSGNRGVYYAPRTQDGKPIAVCSDDANPQTGDSGPPDENDLCISCLERPKNGGFVHGATIHMCYCFPCAQDYRERHAECPICRNLIDRVIRQHIS